MQNFRLCAASVITALLVGCGVTCAFAIPLTPFRHESQAQRHCPADVIVWLELRKGIYGRPEDALGPNNRRLQP